MTAKLDGLFAWFKANKAAIGVFLITLAGVVAGTGTLYGSDALVKAAAVIGMVGTALAGGGVMKSDQFYRDRAEVLETRIDRRAPRSARAVDVYVEPQTIPQADLMKLATKVEPDDPSKALKG
jgi:hypothetical protein